MQDLGREVGDLRAEDGDRVPTGRVVLADQDRVAGAAIGAQDRAQVDGQAGDRDLAQAGIRGGQRPAVAHGGAGLADGHGQRVGVDAGRHRHVRESAAQGDLRAGVILGAEVVPDGRTLRRSVALDEGAVEERRINLGAAADGEDRLDESGDGDDVGGLERHRRHLESGVLGRQQGGVDQGLVEVGVDAVDVGESVGYDLLALAVGRVKGLRVTLRQRVNLSLQFRVVVAGDAGHLAVQGQGRLGRAQEGGEGGAADVPEHVHHEEAVLGRRVARAELGVRAGRAEDVGHAEAPVADDDRSRSRAVGPLDVGPADAEAGLLEVAAEVGGLQVRRDSDQVGVHRALVVAMRRRLPGGRRGGVDEAVLARRQDVVDLTASAVGVGAARGTGHGLAGRGEGGNGGHEAQQGQAE